MKQITKDMTFSEILRSHQDAPKLLASFNMGCVGCMGAQHETLEQGAIAHGLDSDALLQALNRMFEEAG